MFWMINKENRFPIRLLSGGLLIMCMINSVDLDQLALHFFSKEVIDYRILKKVSVQCAF